VAIAVNLRKAMQEIWPLPPEDMLNFSGPEWLLMLIDRVDAHIAVRILLVLWRAWFARNELVHSNKWLTSNDGGICFLPVKLLGYTVHHPAPWPGGHERQETGGGSSHAGEGECVSPLAASVYRLGEDRCLL
jgi:hypothetical protein